MTQANDKLARFNALWEEDAARELLKCCGSTEWAAKMAALRPFQNLEDLLSAAHSVWWELKPEEWLAAFSQHPKIGERQAVAMAGDGARFGAARWSEDEQSGIRDASKEIMASLELANALYARKVGFIFIVCATGKTSSEMLALLDERLLNGREEEIRIAAGEQARITRLRLKKLLG